MISTSFCGIGTLNLVDAVRYSEFSVIKDEAWFPAAFGISIISVVSKVVKEYFAILGVLFAFMKIHLPSGAPLV